MNADLARLIELDKVNQEISRLKDEVASLPRRVAEIEAKLNAAKARVESATAAIKTQEANKRTLETEIKDWQQKISKFREQSLGVKTNDQYRALMHEIDFAEKFIAECEEKILIGMESSDQLQASLKEAQRELAEDAKEVEKEKAHAKEVTAADEKRLAELRTQQEALRKSIDAATLTLYERVAGKRKNAIAEAFEQKCMACNVMMRPQKYNELLSHAQLVTCDSCGRLLYHDAGRESEGGKAKARGHDRALYFIPDASESGRFLLFSNSKSGCTMRVFDAANGQLLEKTSRKKSTFQEEFPEQLSAGVALRADSLDLASESADQLSPETLEELQLQAQIAPALRVPAAQ
jgi:predicted  nucleic acid-binding Zn-ribbon protein